MKGVNYFMFPEYCKISEAEDVFGFNGYDSIPAYRKTSIENPNNNTQIVTALRNIGHNCCGFIENNEIHYHLCDSDAYFINMNDNFVFAYFKDEYFKNQLPVLIILEFLKYKANKIILVYEETYFVLEKTKETYHVCEKLDEIYSSRRYIEDVFVKFISNEQYAMIFHKLIEIFSMRYMNKDTRRYNDIDVMMKVLRLEIS